jgi:chemotaxis protein MotB
MVEGHTDNVPLTGNGVLIDNWDLSVKRTSIIRINRRTEC